MSKQTSTARSIHDLFSDDHANPPSGDEASQGEMKSDSASASVARPSRPAAVGSPDHTEGVMRTYADAIWVYVDGSGNFGLPQDVKRGGTVWLVSTGSGPVNVCTYIDHSLQSVFKEALPYSAALAPGTRYTLDTVATGKQITLDAPASGSCASTLSHRHNRDRDHDHDHDHDDYGDKGMNGIINVGG